MSPYPCHPLSGRPIRLLTLGELRRAWADLPDDAPVVVSSFTSYRHILLESGEHYPSAEVRVVDLYAGRTWVPMGARDPEVQGEPTPAALIIPRGEP